MASTEESVDPLSISSRYITDAEKSYIIESIKNDQFYNYSQLAKAMKRDRSTVLRYCKKNGLVIKKVEDYEDSSPVPNKKGRPSKIYDEERANYLINEFLREKWLSEELVNSADEIRDFMIENDLCEYDTSILTVRRYLNKIGINFKSIFTYPNLEKPQKEYRVKTALTNQLRGYKSIMFSDESIIRIRETKTKAWLRRKTRAARRQFNKGNGGIMIFGVFSYYGFSDLQVFPQRAAGVTKNIDSQTYIWYLSRTLPGVMASHPSPPAFLQDNAKIHTSKATSNYLRRKRYEVVSHPPYSPDLNPIEKVWASMKRELKRNSKNFKSIKSLTKASKDVWNQLMSNDDYRHKLCYRYSECNMCCVMNQGEFVLDSDLDQFRSIKPTPKKL